MNKYQRGAMINTRAQVVAFCLAAGLASIHCADASELLGKVSNSDAHQQKFKTVSMTIKAYIDGSDLLIIKGNTLQWKHQGWAAVGRWMGQNQPTVISTSVDGVTRLDKLEWTPDWRNAPPDELRYACESASYNLVNPELAQADMDVSLTPLQARGPVTLIEQPSAGNQYTTVIQFDDDKIGGAEWYEIRLDFSTDRSTTHQNTYKGGSAPITRTTANQSILLDTGCDSGSKEHQH